MTEAGEGLKDGFAPARSGVWHLLARMPIWLAALALFALMCMTFLDVLLRSVANNPIESATELTRLFMAVVVFASLPAVTWSGKHIVVDLMDPLFPPRAARARDIAIDLACGAMLLWPAKRVWDLAERARDFGDVTEYLGFPQHVAGWFIAAFAAATSLAFFARAFARLFSPSKASG